ncbi:hypothetical protein CHS0354_030647 [Potamilus streckersoni]|uniref:RNA-binding protein 5 n=1 Tax=Potamilus streckersoni TaxID=2493646 RepID=A0AAE0SHX1_9BIVA|nr:hypothetical protein CHS0354_030647 [Potamilus streckersoni]
MMDGDFDEEGEYGYEPQDGEYPDISKFNNGSYVEFGAFTDGSGGEDSNYSTGGGGGFQDVYQEGEYAEEDSGCMDGDQFSYRDFHQVGSQPGNNKLQNDRDRSNRGNRSERRRDRRRHDSDRDKSRDRDRNRDRTNRRDRGRERDGRDRGRDRSGDLESYNSGKDGRDRDRTEWDRNGRRDRDHDRRDRDGIEERGGEKWMTDTPTNTVLLRGLPLNIEEKDIRAELMFFGAPIKDVRLMRRSSGASRGFAFVEFQNVADAQRWMDLNQGKLMLQNQYTASMHYSTPKTGPDKQQVMKTDWTCSKCGVHNFKRRDYCFKCNISREESDRAREGDGYDQVGTNPSLIFRGLDALTTEDNLVQALAAVTSVTVKNVRVIRDTVTGTSQGYGFIELNSVLESTQMLETLLGMNPPFEVDGKQILVSFAKNTFTTVMATFVNTTQGTPASWDASQQSGTTDYYQQPGYDYSTQQGFDQSYYAQTGQYYDGQNYDYTFYNQQQAAAAGTAVTSSTAINTQTDSTNAAAAVAQAAIQQAQAARQQYKKQIEESANEKASSSTAQPAAQSQEKTEYPKYPPPDVSLYQYDESSGYYYDPSTGLYYDANTQYYYNGQTGQFLYWDAEKSTYLPAPTGDENKPTEDKEEKKKENKDKKEKVKIAKKIAKDMEKWAKTLNAQKEAQKEGKRVLLQQVFGRKDEKESATADAGFAILEKSKSEDKKLMPPPPTPVVSAPSQSSIPGLVASYGGDSDSEEEDQMGGVANSVGSQVDESKLVDLTKMACLLCKRRFQNKESLLRHQQMSDLHKQNLEALQKSKGGNSELGFDNIHYRDRAKERRDKYGMPAPPEPRRKAPSPVIYEEPTKAGIGQENIGNKLLQKMGWSEGQGLGRAGQGIVKPIEAEKRAVSAGLGMRGSTYGAAAGDSYKDAVKKTMYARYHEMD